jgi:hypothetical protein
MQVTEIQVQRSLEALQAVRAKGGEHGSPESDEVPEGLLDLLEAAPPIRLDRMADAKMRLAAGCQPSDDDLAARLVGRLVCDRLR